MPQFKLTHIPNQKKNLLMSKINESKSSVGAKNKLLNSSTKKRMNAVYSPSGTEFMKILNQQSTERDSLYTTSVR